MLFRSASHMTLGQLLDEMRDAALVQRAPAPETLDVVQAIANFHRAFGVALVDSWTNPERRDLRRRLIVEEFIEYIAGESNNDATETLDALVDLVYVIVGAALEYGMDFAGAFRAVHAANMAKLGPTGEPIMREDGKVLKPAGWRPADLTPYIAALPATRQETK